MCDISRYTEFLELFGNVSKEELRYNEKNHF